MLQGELSLFQKQSRKECLAKKNKLFPGEDIDLMKLRANVFPIRELLHRINRYIDPTCRRCHEAIETLGHISGACPSGRGCRIARHDLVFGAIHSKAAEAGWTVAREQLFDTDVDPLRPDLVIKTLWKAFIVDITVELSLECVSLLLLWRCKRGYNLSYLTNWVLFILIAI